MADYAISNVPRRVVYAASGTGPYAFTFEILSQTDIAVYKASTLLTLTTDYTVTINANGTGSVTLVATAGTDNITIVGAKNIQRTTDFTTGGDLFANTLNDELDNQTIFIQQVAETAERGLKAPVTDPTDIAMTLPAKASRANKYLGFNGDGNPVAVDGTSVSPGTMADQNSNNVGITGGTITGITDLAIADGGTGASTAAAAPFALKGSNSDITALSGLTTALSVGQGGTGAASLSAGNVLLGNGTSAIQSVAPGTSGNVLTSNGTTWTSSAASGGSYIGQNRQLFITSGTFTVPTGITAVKVTMVGGGGGGAAGAASAGNGAGGGAAGACMGWFTGLTPGGTIAVTVGAAGTGGTGAGGAGGAGGQSIFSTFTANGGSGGTFGNASGGAGGACSSGSFFATGNAGGGIGNNFGGSGTIYSTLSAVNWSVGGGAVTGASGIAGIWYGGGGSGGDGTAIGFNPTGGAGRVGMVLVEW
jgi:hypothetical protein